MTAIVGFCDRGRVWMGAPDDTLQEWFESEVRRRAQLINGAIASFLYRTKLPLSEVALVQFRGKEFPQWKGAVRTLPQMVIE
jgi:hypothetical protein